ncbi:MAG: RsmE family RNA methyltransferase [Candidatus Zixiibacteriota bacterium]
MVLPVFYAPPENIVQDTITLPDAESRHAISVMRLKRGALVLVVDGLGTAYQGEIRTVGAGCVGVCVHSQFRHFGEPSFRLTLAAGMSAGEKFDTIVEKGTELGVKRFVPIISVKSKVKLEEPKRIKSRLSRLERVALAAIKQCRRSYRPDISPPITLVAYLNQFDPEALNLIFAPEKTAVPLDKVSIDPDLKRVNLLVGPESGFSSDEIEMAVRVGFTPVSLGQRILRTETAGPAVCALIMYLMGELR